MGAFLNKPLTDKQNETGGGNGLRYGVSSMQGWRVEMEDDHCAMPELPGHLKDWSFYAVFDGHAGGKVSELCANELLDSIMESGDFKNIDPDMMPKIEEIRAGILEGFLTQDKSMRDRLEPDGQDNSGSTAVCALITPQHIFFANCGDSRAVLVSNSSVEFSTEDHKPSNPGEKNRIINAGGNVMIQRVNGTLAVSRSLGDYDYKRVEGKGPKEQLVSPEPDVTVINRNSGQQILILACDGVWDVMSNEEICEYVLHQCKITDNLSDIGNNTIDMCLHKGSRDNMSMIVVAFENCPKVDIETAQLDRQMDERIEEYVREILLESSNIDLNTVCAKIAGFISVPGGMESKKALIERKYELFSSSSQEESGST